MVPAADLVARLADSILGTVRDVIPIAGIIFFFQFIVLRRRVANLPRVLAGFGAVVGGLAVFLVGLEIGLFPLGEAMARQLLDLGVRCAPATPGRVRRGSRAPRGRGRR
jgi:hypothetical protein